MADLKPIIVSTLMKMIKTCDHMSMGEVFYSITRKSNLDVEQRPDETLDWLREIKDEDFLIAIEKAKKDEEPEQ